MKPRGLSESGGMQILDDFRIDARLYRALEHHAEVMASGVDVQALLAVAACLFFEVEHPKWCACQSKANGLRARRASGGRKRGRGHSTA